MSEIQVNNITPFSGNTVEFAGNISASGNIIAQQYLVQSVTESAMLVNGSNQFGNSADDTHTFTGNITASNDISASGTISANNYIGSISATGLSEFGNITASGDISASGVMIAGSSHFGTITASQFISMSAGTIFAKSIGLATSDPGELSVFNTLGTINIGQDTVNRINITKGNVTASGAISASGNLKGNFIFGDQFQSNDNVVFQHTGGVTNIGTPLIPNKFFGSNFDFQSGPVTASNISASGVISSSGLHITNPVEAGGYNPAEHFGVNLEHDRMRVTSSFQFRFGSGSENSARIRSDSFLMQNHSADANNTCEINILSDGDFRVRTPNNILLAMDCNPGTGTAVNSSEDHIFEVGTGLIPPISGDVLFRVTGRSTSTQGDIDNIRHVTASGDISASGNVIADSYIENTQTVAAAGSAASDATAISASAGVAFVSTDSDAKGIILPAVSTVTIGQTYTLLNTSAEQMKVYPNVGDRIFPLSDDTAATLPDNASMTVTAFSADGWQGFIGTVIS